MHLALPRDTFPGTAAVPKRTSLQEYGSTVGNRDDSARGKWLRPPLVLAPYLARYRPKTVSAWSRRQWRRLRPWCTGRGAVHYRLRLQLRQRQLMSPFSLMIVSLMIALVVLLALARASRVYRVTTLGERIVATCVATCFRISLRYRRPFSKSAGSGGLVSRLTRRRHPDQGPPPSSPFQPRCGISC